ncbi:phosphoenolpyruvate--protein phosphotransferase [Roseateles aquatilis]|uniref:Phosphoenolpyruvate-protein phosphotransferase n=1 Tax=Roseateles aquatilis TaxID=431061 RepID=A0A2D0AM94_9BURK|nr:phosphoenolpyruvate--protein phosphotransferase [Roseateles aquatilis]OWQ85342.1 phosphoenolpyruvate--protein phosphotransferase [Roseateles aquatilis]
MSFQVFGIPVSRGVAIGRAVLVASSRVDVAHYFIAAADAEQEYARLVRGRDVVTRELQSLKADLPDDAPHELDALLDVHLLLLNDEALVDAARDWIVDRHYNAEWALSAQLEVLARQFDEMEDDYLRERKADLEQVVERVLSALAVELDDAAVAGPAAVVARDFAGEDPLLLVAADIAPADMIQFKRSVFQGFITDIGGKTSHTAIVARSMDIPAVVGTREASRLIRQDDWVIIDGDAGTVIVNPSPIILEEYRFRQRQSELERARLARLRHTPAITLDGQRIELHANIELPGDTVAALASGATGVGLFRSEFLFMNRDGDLPTEEEQFAAYKAAVEAMAGLPVTIRTVDIGADKPLDRMSVNELRHEHVLNPAMGLRAIRWSLAEPSMFRQQLRAIYRASAFGKVKLLIPMVAHLGEIRQVQEAIKRVKVQLDDAGQMYGRVEVGVMIEVPAAAIMLPHLVKHVDFVSIGTNDLIQYTLAIDRADEAVAHLYDPWHPAVLHLLAGSIAQARAAGKEVSVCGEMAGDAAFTDLLLGMGLRCFSMHPSQIPSVKQRILRADSQRLAAVMPRILDSDEPAKTAAEALTPQSRLH